MNRSSSANRMRVGRHGLRVGSVLAGLLFAAGTLTAAPVDHVSLCEGRPDCDGADIRVQGDIPSNGNVGFSMAMGYLDDDNFADLVVAAPDVDTVYVFFGGVDRSVDDDWPAEIEDDRGLDVGAADLVIIGGTQSRFGFSVAVAPGPWRINRVNTLVVGAPASDDDASAGNAYVIPASFFAASRPTGSYDLGSIPGLVTLSGAQPGDETGYSVALGPVLSAGADDIVVGARLANGERGTVYAVAEDPGTAVVDLGTDADVTVTGAVVEEGIGEFLAIADFATGSPTWEIAIGAVGTTGTGDGDTDLVGRVYMLDLTVGDMDLDDFPQRRIEGASGGDFFGFTLAAGRFDGNTVADLAVGAVYADRDTTRCPTDETNSGAVYVLSDFFLGLVLTGNGTQSWDPDPYAFTFWGDAAWDELGFGLATARVNDDDTDDLIATARKHDRAFEVDQVDEGAAYVFYGPVVSFAPGASCLDCTDDDCSTWDPQTGIGAMIFGGDYDTASRSSDEIGFSVAAGDFNGNSMFDDIAVSSVTHERAYLVTFQNTDAAGANPGGQETDDYRDIRDRDDDGDGYLDTEEDEDLDGDVNASESDPLTPNRDVTVSVDPQGDVSCDGTDEIEVAVTVTNAGQLNLSNPLLRVWLPEEAEPDSERTVFEYVEQSTAIDGTSIADEAKVCQNAPSQSCLTNADCPVTPGESGVCTAFPFVVFRPLTESGNLPLPGSESIEVRFRLKVVFPLDYGTPTTDVVSASVQLVPVDDPDELPYPHATSGLSQPNNDSATVTVLLPDLIATKSSTDLSGGDVVPFDVLEYTVTISNTGPWATFDARSVGLSDEIPANTSLVTGSASSSQGTVSEGDPLTADLGTIALGADATVTFQVRIDETTADGTEIGNGATITESCLADRVTDSTNAADDDAVELGNDPDEPFDDDSVKDRVVSTAEIVVVKTADRSTAQVGEVIGYGYALSTGGGNVRLNNVSLTDDLCAPVVFQGGDTNADGYLDWAGSGSGAETWIYGCAYTVQSTDPVGPLVNTATARGVAPASGQVNDTDGAVVAIVNTPPMAIDDVESTDTDTPVAVDVLVNDLDANGHALTITNAQSPTDQGGSATIDDGGTPGFPGDDVVDYDPPTGYAGIDSFTYMIDDGFGGSDSATVTVTVSTPTPWTDPDQSYASFDGDRIVWSPAPQASGYHLYRGDLAVVRSGGAYAQDPATSPLAERVCWLTDTSYQDWFVPPAGETVFYLVTLDDGTSEGSLGSASGGVTRPNDYPCR